MVAVAEHRNSVESDWRIRHHVCTAGPEDAPFEEMHDRVTIAAVVEGCFTYHGEHGPTLMVPGALLTGNAHRCFACSHDHGRGDRCVALGVSPAVFEEIAASAAGNSRFGFRESAMAADATFLPWLAHFDARASAGDMLAIEERAMTFVEAVVARASGEKVKAVSISATDSRRVQHAVRHIEEHSDQLLLLSDLATLSGLSKYHFLRIFRCATGQTPYQMLLFHRMRRAAVRLVSGRETVAAIAYDCGFGDLSTFNARFRSQFGVSPRAYRAAN